MSINNTSNDIKKGLYDIAICDLEKQKLDNPNISELYDELISLINGYKNGCVKEESEYMDIINKITDIIDQN